MDTATKNYIDSLDRRIIPWSRMFTAYGTAENYNELLSVLEQTTDIEQWKNTLNRISDFEHQSTMFHRLLLSWYFLSESCRSISGRERQKVLPER